MKIEKISRSFSLKLTLCIFMMVGGVFFLMLAGAHRTASRQVKEDAMCLSKMLLAHTVDEIDKILQGTELVIKNRIRPLSELVEYQDSVSEITRQVVNSNPFLIGSALAFYPGHFESSTCVASYTYRKDGEIHTKELGDSIFCYLEKEWFAKAVTAGEGGWSRPYYDKNGGEERMLTYSQPLFDTAGNCYGMLTADVSMSLLEKQVREMNPSLHSFGLVINAQGDYVVQPNHIHFEKENIFSSAKNLRNTQVKRLAEKMTKGDFGQLEVDTRQGSFYVFYQPVKKMDWAAAVCYHESDLLENVHKMTRQFLVEMVLGLLLIAFVCYVVIQRMTAPLKSLTNSAVKIADGDFSVQVPNLRGKDEMGTLCRSFDAMQHALVDYMERLKQTVKERERMESDLRIAGAIQQQMLPTDFPVYPHNSKLDVFATVVPAKAVGGDFYQYLICDDDFYFILGDVSGKGVSGALVMSALCRLFRFVAPKYGSPSQIVTTLNAAMLDENENNMFATVFVGVLHLSTGELDYCNAGHNAAVFLSQSGAPKWLATEPNLPLGLFDDVNFEEQQTVMHPGESLLLYTDGVTEAENLQQELFSDERLLKVAEDLVPLTSSLAVTKLYDQVVEFAAGAEQNDDITILCVNFGPKVKEAYGKEIGTEK